MILSLNGKPAHQIDDNNWRDYVPDDDFRVRDSEGNEYFTGCLPVEEWDVAAMRTMPFEASGIVLFDEKEIGERLEDMWAAKASLMHLGYQYDSLDQSRGTCFPAGTLIRMGDGGYKPIEKINVTDFVLTAEGNVKAVTQVMARRHHGEICCPWIVGHQHLRATPEHPVLTKRGYVEMQHLQKGDLVAFPKYAANTRTYITPAEYLPPKWVLPQKSGETTRHGNGGAAYRYCIADVPDRIDLTESFGRLIGMFLAEGCADATRLTWTFNINETNTLAAETCDLIRACCDAEPIIRQEPHKNVVRVFLFGRRWRELFTQLCSHGASCKRLHPHLLEGPIEFLQGAMSGWHAGDKKTECSAATVSHEMAMNMFDIANVLSKRPRFEYMPEHTDKNGVHHQAAYVVWWENRTMEESEASLVAKRWKTEDEPDCMWRRIESVEHVPFDGWVFNLEVEDDHSYVAEGIGVHNCWIHGTCGAASLMFAQANVPYRVPSPASVAYHCYSNFGVNGGYPTLGVEKFQQYGATTVDLWPENGHSKSYDKAETRDNRKYQWLEEVVETGSGEAGFWRCMSAICQGFPVGLSYSWWRHYVYGCWGRLDRREVKIGIRNSWGNSGYGDKGFGLLASSRKYPSWSCAFLRMRQSPGA